MLLLLAAGLCWRLARYAAGFPLWGDEAFLAVNYLMRDFAGLFHPLEWGQIAPLLFNYAQLAVVRAAGVNEWSLRVVPFLSGLAALFLMIPLANRLLPRRAAVLAVGWLAASYYVVRHGAEVKPYASDLLFAMLILWFAIDVLRAPGATWRWLVLAMVCAISVWASYPSVFVAGGAAITLTLRAMRSTRGAPEDRASWIGWAALAVVLGASFGLMYFSYAKPHAAAAAKLVDSAMWSKVWPPVDRPWMLPLWLIYMCTDLMFAHPHGGTKGGSAATFALFLVGLVSMCRRAPWQALLLVAPFGLGIAAAFMHAYPFGGSARTMLYVAPSICLLAAYGAWLVLVRLTPHAVRRHALNAVVLALVALSVGGSVAALAQPYASDESKRGYDTVAQLASAGQPGDTWIVFNAVEPTPYAPWLGDWRGTGGQFVFDVKRFAPRDLRWAPDPNQTPLPSDPQRVLLLAYSGVRADFPQDQFDAYREALERRLGPARNDQTVLKTRDGRVEAISVWRFGSSP